MAKHKTPKVSRSKTLERSKKKERPLKANITFRIREDLLKDLDKICKKAKVNKVTVIEDLLEQFVESNS